ncbi:MAG TPA: SdiA-regulated domain-containing protein [Prolixibacteraceae bacterium]|nr:SdiA-regulated domain-containing protein [Prolixibacteraceae bacterium]
MGRHKLSILTVFLITLFACRAHFTNNEKLSGYNLTAPDTALTLPDILHEISGLTYVDSTTFACIQDEKGILFIYDWKQNEIEKQYTFHIDGDYEGIARIGKTMYVLRSDGTLFEISDYESGSFKLDSFATGIPANNNEGLCYDPDNNRLLIACKGKIDKGPELKDKRVIYSFDLLSKTMSTEPVFDFDLQTIKAFAQHQKVNLPAKSKKKGKRSEPVIKFMTSDIGIHPLTKKLFLLSASDHLLFIFTMNGDIEHIEQLDPQLFNKAEGITFLPSGDMLITNEGQDERPTLLQFKYIL